MDSYWQALGPSAKSIYDIGIAPVIADGEKGLPNIFGGFLIRRF